MSFEQPIMKHINEGIAAGAVSFEPELNVMLTKSVDELSAYRVRKLWRCILEDYFLLEEDIDFHIQIEQFPGEAAWSIVCSFETASGRYAFWRMINNHVPEVVEKLTGKNNKKQTFSEHLKSALGVLSFSADDIDCETEENKDPGTLHQLF